MNSKTAKKLLMKGRATSIWGKRAYLTVRLPVAVVPTPKPESLTFEGLLRGSGGSWHTEDYSDVINIGKWSMGADPRKQANRNPWEPIYFAHKEYEGDDGYQHWSYWTGARHRQVGTDENGQPIHERTPIDEAAVARHKAYQEWHDRLHEYGQHPLLDTLLSAGEAAKSTYFSVEGENLLVTFGVKWFHPNRKLRFASGLSRAFRLAKRSGIPIRVIGAT